MKILEEFDGDNDSKMMMNVVGASFLVRFHDGVSLIEMKVSFEGSL